MWKRWGELEGMQCDVYKAGDRGEMASIAWGWGRNIGILHGVCKMGGKVFFAVAVDRAFG